jgi:hypothetical protein
MSDEKINAERVRREAEKHKPAQAPDHAQQEADRRRHHAAETRVLPAHEGEPASETDRRAAKEAREPDNEAADDETG